MVICQLPGCSLVVPGMNEWTQIRKMVELRWSRMIFCEVYGISNKSLWTDLAWKIMLKYLPTRHTQDWEETMFSWMNSAYPISHPFFLGFLEWATTQWKVFIICRSCFSYCTDCWFYVSKFVYQTVIAMYLHNNNHFFDPFIAIVLLPFVCTRIWLVWSQTAQISTWNDVCWLVTPSSFRKLKQMKATCTFPAKAKEETCLVYPHYIFFLCSMTFP